jgi:Fe2+ or Zn2+ uptake regulation protein
MNTRNTFQRQVILEFLRKTCSHPSAETIHKVVVKQVPTITLATVYRNLNILADQGIIRRLEVNKEYRYDGCIANHQHCVCSKCGKILDYMEQELTDYALKNIPKKEFKPTKVNMIFEGKCKKCVSN